MTITVVGDPTTNPRYFRKLNEINLDVHRVAVRPASQEQLAAVHTSSYLKRTADGYSEEWVGRRPDLVARASTSAGSALRAASTVYRGDARKVFVPDAGRPHAFVDSSDRGCVYNDIALTAAWFRRRGWTVTVIDLDGLYAPALENLLRGVEGVSTVSIHEDTISAGPCQDVAAGVYRFPLNDYSDSGYFIQEVDKAVEVVNQHFPEVILLNVGVTGHDSDELTTLEFTIDGIYEAVVRISQAADEVSASRLIGFGGIASAGNEWASSIWAAATHAMSLPYLRSSATRHAPRLSAVETSK